MLRRRKIRKQEMKTTPSNFFRHSPVGRVSGLALCLHLAPALAQAPSASANIILAPEALPPLATQAQPAQTKAATLDPIVVTGTRTEHRLSDSPVEVQLITAADIARSGARDVAELLEREGSVHVTRAAGRGTTIQIQGLSSEHVLILLNGRRLIGRINGAIDLTRIRVAEIERVEIVRGATSALYGSDALGGVVNIITRRGAEALSLTARSADDGALDVFGHGGWGDNKLTLQASGGFSRLVAYDLDDSTASEDGADSDASFFGLNGDWILNDAAELGVSFAYSLDDSERIDGGIGGGQFETNKRIEEIRGGVSPHFLLGYNTELRLDAYYHRYHDQFLQERTRSDASREVNSDEETIDQIYAGSAQLDHQWGTHRLSIGGEYQFEELQADRLQTAAERDRQAVFIQDEWSLLDGRLTLVPGLRMDRDSQFGEALSPKVALRYDVTDSWLLRAGWGEGFRAPDFKQLQLRFENSAVAYRVDGNPNLEPEESSGFHLGTTWFASATASFYISAYHNDVSNLIQIEQIETGPPTIFTYNNVAEAELTGVDLQAQWRPWAPLQIKLGYGYLRSRDRDTGERLSGRPEHRANAALYWEKPSYALVLRGVWVGDRIFTVDTSNGPPTPGGEADPYALFDLRAEWRGLHWAKLALGLDNLFDEGDPQYLAITPRTVYLEIQRAFE